MIQVQLEQEIWPDFQMLMRSQLRSKVEMTGNQEKLIFPTTLKFETEPVSFCICMPWYTYGGDGKLCGVGSILLYLDETRGVNSDIQT